MRIRSHGWDFVGLAAFGLLAVALVHMRPEQAPPGPLTDASPEVQPGEEWLGLYFQGRKVGHAHLEKARRDDGWRFRVRTQLRVGAGTPDIELDLAADLGAELVLQAFEFTVEAGESELQGRGRVEGRRIALETESGGETTTRTLDLARPPVLRGLDGPALARQDLRTGARFTLHAFDPITQSDQAVDVEVVGPERLVVMGQEVDTTRLRQRLSGMTLDAWINARGEVLRQEMGLGLVALRESEEEARWTGPGADLPAATTIEVAGLPPRLDAAVRLELRLTGVELAFPDLDGDRQRLEGDRLTITREVAPTGVPRGAPEPAEHLVQSDHPEIRALANEIAAGATDTLEIARRLLAWIRAHVRQRSVPGVPSALETLRNRVGDCNEHAVLFAALARSAGVPTRVVTGLVYRDGRFAWHAWNEVTAAGGWVPVDPTWSQLPADVGHVRLVRGGLARQVELLHLMGRLRIQALRLEP